LRNVYDTAPPDHITASMLFDYRAKRSEKSIVQANRELSCMSAVFREAIGWHAVEGNPCRELKRRCSAQFPFLLTTGRNLYQFNAGTMTQRTRNRELRRHDTLDIARRCGSYRADGAKAATHCQPSWRSDAATSNYR
jgi:hypothetical protein